MSSEEKPVNEKLQKSSMEILSELFSTFHAKPPLIIKQEVAEENKKHHKKKHKHKDKKKRKKDKKRRRDSGSSSEGSDIDLAQLLIKQEKEVANKKIKIEGTECEIRMSDCKTERANMIKQEKINDTRKNIDCSTEIKNEDGTETKLRISKEDHGSELFPSYRSLEIAEEGEISDSDSENSNKSKHKKHKKRKHKSDHEKSKKKQKHEQNQDTKKHKSREKDRHERSTSNERRKSKDAGHSWERGRSKEKEVRKNKLTDRSLSKDRNNSKERHKDHKFRSKDKYEYHDYKDHYKHKSCYKEYNDFYKKRKENPFYKYDDSSTYRDRENENRWTNRYRYRPYDNKDRNHTYRDRSSSREKAHIDKKKLLEIARKNAIQMMKSGSLPGALSLGPQAQEKVIAAIKGGGKTIEELTDFCKTLSKKEELGELSSASEENVESDSDNDKPFHHPFQIKDRPTSITMNIKNSVPLPLKSTQERTTELRIQFPVSSGQQHRKTEEWIPVTPKKSEAAAAQPLQTVPPPQTVTPPHSIPLPPNPPPVPAEKPRQTVPAPSNALPGPQVFPNPALEVIL